MKQRIFLIALGIAIFILLFAVRTAIGQQYPQPINNSWPLNFWNTNSGAIVSQLPLVITNSDGSLIKNPSGSNWFMAGWRTVLMTGSPASGIYDASQYTGQDNGDGTCNLISVGSVNQTVSSDAVITNSVYWSSNFVTTLQLYRSIMRAYQGQSGETNIVSTVTIATFLGQNPTWYTGTNAANMTLELLTANNILLYYPQYTNTMQWWQQNGHLVP